MSRKKKPVNNSGIPQHIIESIARCILPDIIAYYAMKQDRRGIGFALYLDLLEELEEEGDGYDVDVLLVYDSKAQASSVAAKKDELISEGLSVYSATNVPEKIRYKKIVKVN